MERAVFSWDGEHAPQFVGWHFPEERWNGFAVPWFDLETVREIAAATAELGEGYDVVEIRDDADAPEGVSVWITANPDDGHTYETETTTTRDGQTLYAVGGWCWTWDDVRTLMPDLTEPDDDTCLCEIPFTGQCASCQAVPPMDADGKCVRCREWARDCLCQ